MSLLQEMEQHGLADCEFNNKMLHFDNVIFPKAIDFIDRNAKPAVNRTQVMLEIFNAYEDGNSHYELRGQFTRSNNPELFLWENLKCS